MRRKKPLLADETLKQRIYRANVSVHRQEAQHYELLHPEVYSVKEQKRITVKLEMVINLVSDNKRIALDVGAGTGNLTGKLLQKGYQVTAVDISPEMCAILQRKYGAYLKTGKLTIVNSPLENLSFDVGKFDLITCYSALHHLPDYVSALRSLNVFLKKGGVIYIDHEASPYYWQNKRSSLASFIKDIYFHSNPLFNSLYFQIIGLRVPLIDYSLSDYWHKKEHALNHKSVEEVFKQEGYEFSRRADYYQNSTWIWNPLSLIYRLIGQPEMSFWIAKK
jgi:ubiquinone/menaquinone biosynthesis C-methylase UbiE